jgi:hypothetical protein
MAKSNEPVKRYFKKFFIVMLFSLMYKHVIRKSD